jgi:hypothetical protein
MARRKEEEKKKKKKMDVCMLVKKNVISILSTGYIEILIGM